MTHKKGEIESSKEGFIREEMLTTPSEALTALARDSEVEHWGSSTNVGDHPD